MTTIETDLTPMEKTILNIITKEPNITSNLIRTTIQRQGQDITKTQLNQTLQKLTKQQLIKTQQQTLASITYTIYTLT